MFKDASTYSAVNDRPLGAALPRGYPIEKFEDSGEEYNFRRPYWNEKEITSDYLGKLVTSTLDPSAREIVLLDYGIGDGSNADAAIHAIRAGSQQASIKAIFKEFAAEHALANIDNLARWLANSHLERIVLTNGLSKHATTFTQSNPNTTTIERTLFLRGESPGEFAEQINAQFAEQIKGLVTPEGDTFEQPSIARAWNRAKVVVTLEIINPKASASPWVEQIRQKGKADVDYAIMGQPWANNDDPTKPDIKANLLTNLALSLSDHGILFGAHAASAGIIRECVAAIWPQRKESLGIRSINEIFAASKKLTQAGFWYGEELVGYGLKNDHPPLKTLELLEREVRYAGQVPKGIVATGPSLEQRLSIISDIVDQHQGRIRPKNQHFVVTRGRQIALPAF